MFATLSPMERAKWPWTVPADGIVFNPRQNEKMCVHGNDGAAQHGKEESEAYMIVHHSRDTAEKQWNETRVISLPNFPGRWPVVFDKLYNCEWFSIMWAEMLSVVRRALLLKGKPPPSRC